PGRLVYFASKRVESGGFYPVRLHEALRWRDAASSFDGVAVTRRETVHWREGGSAERLAATGVTADYFDTLGVQPTIGRAFDDRDLDGEPAVLISDELWRSRFGGAPDVLGRTLDLDGVAHTVLGVMPPGPESDLLGWRDLWRPLAMDEAAAAETQLWGYPTIARLRDGVDVEAAAAEVDRLSARLGADYPGWHDGWAVETRTLRAWMAADLEPSVRLVRWAALLVLLVACVTAGNLLFSSAVGRRREMAVRRTLGAGAAELGRQLAVESAVVAGLAGALGLAAAAVAGRLALAAVPSVYVPETLEGLSALPAGPRVWLAAAGATALAAAVCSALSALAIRRAGPLPAGRSDAGGFRVRSALIAVETALVTVALVGSVLLVKSLARVQSVNPGFDAESLLTLRLEVPPEQLDDADARRVAFEQALEAVRGLPRVSDAATAAYALPLTGGAGVFQLWVEGRTRTPEPDVVVNAQVVSPGFFETFGVDLVAGRGFEPSETWGARRSAVVNETFASSHWPGAPAVGRWIEFGNGERGTVVGVVGDVRQAGLDRGAWPEVYLAWGTTPRSQALVARVEGDPASAVGAVRRRLAEVLPGTPVYDVRTGAEILRASSAARTVTAGSLATFAGFAQALGLLGLYGVVLHWVLDRRRDLAIRVAVGAGSGDLVRWTLAVGLAPVALGLAGGLAASLALGRLVEAQLFGVAAADPVTFAVAAAVIGVTSAAVCWIPARGAAAVDPAPVLRGVD
ncbi:MAG: ABC transporter permease, partial [Acidobacteriota bacterium]